ncbi:MAG TPA: endolytic transglycosylase MltG [Deltaproteobacteria bacterium]|nr:endolytic transglycosylase MltG [Deltaproteobacteria bacterium]
MSAYGFRKRKIFFLALGLLLLVFLGLSACFAHYFSSPGNPLGQERTFVVSQGSSLTVVTSNLEKSGLIRFRPLFLMGARFMGYGGRIKAGEYRLNSRMSPLEILNVLVRGVSIGHPVTIPEGFTIRQIADVLEKKGLANRSRFLALAQDEKVVRRYGLPGSSLEGYLYPDTYRFERAQTAISIIDRMVRRFFQVIAPLKGRIEETGMSLQQVVTLASIVEKETGRGDERPVIASVFLNRLKKGMRLESDPTVIYGIVDFNGNLTRKDLQKAGPYNTYVVKGLPAGPIANPGEESIRAVLFPADTDYLYFVSKNDGSHHFSKTLSEHNRAVRTYQKKARRARAKTS